MVKKWIGILLIVVGVVIGAPVVIPLVVASLVLAWYALKLAAMIAVVYIGYRLFRQRHLSVA